MKPRRSFAQSQIARTPTVMTTRPSAELRRLVVERANYCCEYCLLPWSFVVSTHPVDHIVSGKHGGETIAGNLALSCTLCNLRKGTDIASLEPETARMVSLFHPRKMCPGELFELAGVRVNGLTDVGRTTVELLPKMYPAGMGVPSPTTSGGSSVSENLLPPPFRRNDIWVEKD